MRLILEDRELSNVRKVVIGVVRKRNLEHQSLFLSARDFSEWVQGVADEAIGVALGSEDYDPSRGKAVKFICLKAETIERRDLRQERRYRGRLHDVARERPPERRNWLALIIERREIEEAISALSNDQRAAIALVYFSSVSRDDAGRILGRNRASMDKLLSRARSIMGEFFKERPAAEGIVLETAAVPERRRPGRPRSSLKTGDEPPSPSSDPDIYPTNDSAKRVRRKG